MIDQMLTFAKQLIEVSSNTPKKIGLFDSDMNIVGSHYNSAASSSFFQETDAQLKWSIKEIRKFKKYQQLAQDLENLRQELIQVVKENSDLDELNFGDKLGLFHGDLHGGNLLVNPDTLDILAILDWDFSWQSYEFADVGLSFFESWFLDEKLKTDMMNRINKYESDAKRELISCLEGSTKGKEYRSLLMSIGINASTIVFFVSSWFVNENSSIAIRSLIDNQAEILKSELKCWPELLEKLKNYKK